MLSEQKVDIVVIVLLLYSATSLRMTYALRMFFWIVSFTHFMFLRNRTIFLLVRSLQHCTVEPFWVTVNYNIQQQTVTLTEQLEPSGLF